MDKDIGKYIRDHSYKIIDKKALIGIEIESKNEMGLYYNELTITFLKDGKEVHSEKSEVPFIPAKGLIYVGRCYDFIDFDNINIELISSEEVYEDSYYTNVSFGLDEEKTNGKHLEYKVINDNDVTIPEATLNLLFYNRGELVCGTDVKIGKLINGRTYYFVYDVPEGLEYTDVNTELTLPNTGHLLFKSYFEKYISLEDDINRYSVPVVFKKHETLSDIPKEMETNIKAANKRIEFAKGKAKTSLKVKEFFNVLAKKFFKVLLAFIVVAGVVLTAVSFLITFGAFSYYGKPEEVFESLDKGNGPINLTLIMIIVDIVVVLIGYGRYFRKSFKEHKSKKDILSNKSLKKIIKEENSNIESYNKKIAEFNNDKSKLEKEIKEKNLLIDKENDELKVEDDERIDNLMRCKQEFQSLHDDYPEYKEFLKYNDLDRVLCSTAFETGAITFEAVKSYREIILEKMAEKEKYEQEMAMRRKEQELMAEQTKAIKDAAWSQRWASQQLQAEIAKQASMQQSLIREQIAASDKAAKAAANATAQVNMNLHDISMRQQQDMTYYR